MAFERVHCFRHWLIRMLVTIIPFWAFWSASSLAEEPRAVPKRVGQTGGQTAVRQKAGEPDSGPKLQLGEPTRPREREAVIPLHFTPRREEPSGSLRVEVTLPPGPWRLQRAEAPPRSAWKISARQKRQAAPEAGRASVIEVSVSAGRREIPEGLIGYLRFRLDAPSSPLPAGLAVAKLETAPPAPESETPGPAAAFPPLSADPPLTPSVGCFFFTH